MFKKQQHLFAAEGQAAAAQEPQLTPLLLALWIKYVVDPTLGAQGRQCSLTGSLCMWGGVGVVW